MDPLKTKLAEINEQIEAKRKETQEAWQGFDAKRGEFTSAGNDANNTESEPFKEAEAAHKTYSEKAEALADLEKVRDGLFKMVPDSKSSHTGGQSQSVSTDTKGAEQVKALGDRAAESEGYKRLRESGLLDSERAALPTTELAKSTFGELKALLIGGAGGGTSAGAFINPDYKPYVPQPRRPRRVLDLITIGETGSPTVQYVRQSAFTNVAAETAEATATSTGTKPEATITFAQVTAVVQTIAHWIPATRNALADVPQLRTLVDSQLRYGLEYRLESQVVNGGGTGSDLTGILNTGSILSQPKGSDSVSDAIHKAITQLRLGFIEPNGVALHPNDWEVVRLSRDDSGASAGTGGYLYGPPSTVGAETIWGLPVAVTPAIPDDTGLVGDFRYATLWLRDGMTVLASDSHESFFIKNLIAILAEVRAAFGVTLPAAFCKVTSVD